jgi:hypothetical protein
VTAILLSALALCVALCAAYLALVAVQQGRN